MKNCILNSSNKWRSEYPFVRAQFKQSKGSLEHQNLFNESQFLDQKHHHGLFQIYENVLFSNEVFSLLQQKI